MELFLNEQRPRKCQMFPNSERDWKRLETTVGCPLGMRNRNLIMLLTKQLEKKHLINFPNHTKRNSTNCVVLPIRKKRLKGTDAFKEAKQAIERLERTQQYTEAKKANEDFRAFGLKMKKEYNLKVDLSQMVNKAEVEAEQERLEAERTQREKCHDKVRRRLFGAREAPKPTYRFAGTAIPESYEPRRLAEVDVEIPTDAPQITHEGQSTMLSLGMVSGALVCAACVVKRYYQSLKTQARKVSTGLTELVVQ